MKCTQRVSFIKKTKNEVLKDLMFECWHKWCARCFQKVS